MMKKNILFICVLTFFGCNDNSDYYIKKGKVGKISSETIVKELDSLLLESNLDIVNIIDHGNYNATVADMYTKLDNVKALIYYPWAPYNGTEKKLKWVNDKPVINARTMMW